jgi:hypothetical protein
MVTQADCELTLTVECWLDPSAVGDNARPRLQAGRPERVDTLRCQASQGACSSPVQSMQSIVCV